MAEYIEREALYKEVTEKYHDINAGSYPFNIVAYDMAQLIKSAPTADVVEVKHGEWYLLKNCANEGVYCSVCSKKVYKTDYANQKIKSPYCPNCGAKMDGATDTNVGGKLKEGAEK